MTHRDPGSDSRTFGEELLALARTVFSVPRPPERGRALTRSKYVDLGGSAYDATRYGDWEYGGRCTDFG